jgi:pimeloyl-ACP methyl ester carboxylesterase
VSGISDLVERVVESIERPVVLFAQSMGGVIAVRAALARPHYVRGLVLAATSGGLNVGAFGGTDWRPAFRASNPNTPPWFIDHHEDLSTRFAEVRAPVLLLWGDADPISPVAVGERLSRLFVDAELVVVKRGTHDLVSESTPEILPYIERFMKKALSLWQGC